jgi:hypothetical protein
MYIYFLFSHRVRLIPLGTAATVWPIVPAPDDRWWWLWSNWWDANWQGKPKYSEKTCHFVHHKSHVRLLTAWAMARPKFKYDSEKRCASIFPVEEYCSFSSLGIFALSFRPHSELGKFFFTWALFSILSVGIAQSVWRLSYRLDDQEIRVRFLEGQDIFSSSKRLDRLCGPPSFL